ncbi:MAG TPA: hypothetical protein VGL21_13540 [Jatrophihabitantaceae bacterium]
MTAPPWGHKPPRVADIYDYWLSPPPEPSPRLTYWLRRLDEGSWCATHRQAAEGMELMADWLGVYLWEWSNVIYPRCCEVWNRRAAG